MTRLIREFAPYLLTVAETRLVAVQGTYRALLRHGVLTGHEDKLIPLRPGSDGGIVELAERVVLPQDHPDALDAVICLIDPGDPASLFPETLALMRECIVAQKLFFSTYETAHEWLCLRWQLNLDSGIESPSDSPPWDQRGLFWPEADDNSRETIALIAHDGQKTEMVRFAREHFDLLDSFKRRIGTGTTASLLNGGSNLAPRLDADWQQLDAEAKLYEARGFDPPSHLQKRQQRREELLKELGLLRTRLDSAGKLGSWVEELQSGPEGGDVQIAGRVIARECRRIIFFEDPQVAREHETSIQLLERTARMPGAVTTCFHDYNSAKQWALMRTDAGWSDRTLVRAFRQELGVHLVLVDSLFPLVDPDAAWRATVAAAGRFVFWEIMQRAALKARRGQPMRVGTSWGNSVHMIVEGMRIAWNEARERDREDPHAVIPSNTLTCPIVGILGAINPGVEANGTAALLAQLLSCEALTIPLYAFQEARIDHDKHATERLAATWEELDIVIFSVCPPAREVLTSTVSAALPAGLYEDVIGQGAVGEIAGMYLRDVGTEVVPAGYVRVGLSHAKLAQVARGGGAILVAGGQEERMSGVRAALAGHLVSVLITNYRFARELMEQRRDVRR